MTSPPNHTFRHKINMLTTSMSEFSAETLLRKRINPLTPSCCSQARRLTWHQLALQHVQGDDVDDEHPAGTVEQVVVVLDESQRGHALGLEPRAVRVLSLQLTVHVLVEFLQVE